MKTLIRIPQEQTTAYLLGGTDGYLQIDTGYKDDYATYRGALEKHGIALDQIRYLLLTHHHDDHAGYLNELTRDNPGLRIIAHFRTQELLRAGENDKSRGGGLLNRRIYLLFRLKQLMKPDWDLTFEPFELRDRDIILDDESIPIPADTGINGSVIHTPGHSSDSVSLLTDSGDLFCGDLSSNFLNWAGAHYATLFNESMEEVYQSCVASHNK